MPWDVQSTWSTIQSSPSVVIQPSLTEFLATVTSPADRITLYILLLRCLKWQPSSTVSWPWRFLESFWTITIRAITGNQLFHIYVPCFYRHTNLIQAALTAMDSYTEIN